MDEIRLRVGDIMSAPVVCLDEDISLPLADWLMRERHIRHLPVVGEDRGLIGMVTHRTLLAARAGDADGYFVPVAEIMMTDPPRLSPDMRAADAARILVENKLGAAVVVDDDDRVVGIVTEADFVEVAARLLVVTPRIAVDDFMTTDVITMSPDESLELADAVMARGRFRHLPVIDGEGRPVSVVTSRDLLAARVDPAAPRRVSDLEARDLWTVASGSSARTAARTLADHRFGCLPVTRDGVMIGLITEADILALLVRVLGRSGAFRQRDGMPLLAYMSSPVRCIGIDASLEDARIALREHGFSSLAVVSETRRLVGVITTTDLVAAGSIERGSLALPEGVVGDRMTRGVISVDIDASITEAARALVDSAVHRVFVIADRRLAGVISTTDIIAAVRDLRIHTPVSEIMSRLVFTIGPDESIDAGLELLRGARIRALVVTEIWPIGVLDQRRLLDRSGARPSSVIEDVMSTALITVPRDLPAFRAAALMAELGVDHAVVTDGDKAVGVVSGTDMARLCASETVRLPATPIRLGA